jgi:hypothetical protein
MTDPQQVPEQDPNKEGQTLQPNREEINPSKPGNNTEVDLDKSKIQTYPDKNPPERH